jgi:hypothetical protein
MTQTPQRTLEAAVDRAAEITWWNRALTRLNDVVSDEAATEFVLEDLIEQKGPYVEFVDAPKFADEPATTFLRSLGYDEAVLGAVTAELFGGDTAGSLYRHQAETIRAIEADTNDNILAVPTATGKTESFFIPILQHCLRTDESGLKSIIVYPMKTLGVDQLNRFITYLDRINRNRDPADRITIGVWDSDTPTRVGARSYEIEKGSYVRGLECPREDGAKLKILDNLTVGTDNNQYSWIRVTRDAIRSGVDVLLTNPEALDHMFVNDNPETRAILGETPGEHPVEHIVFDEAHVWSGVSGASIRLLSERLTSYYANRDPQITMVSATVDNPSELAGQLTGSDRESINSIGFTPREFPITGTPDFTRLAPTDVEGLVRVMAAAHLTGLRSETLRDELGLGDALETALAVGIVDRSGDGEVTLDAGLGDWLRGPLETTASELLDDGYDTPAELVRAETASARLTEAVLDSSGLYSGWFDYIIQAAPEVAEFARWFSEETTGEVGFKHYESLLERLAERRVADPEGTLETVMALGRLAGMVTEKYHTFLKPPHKAYLCPDCRELTRNKSCPACGTPTDELQFCRRNGCHHPYIEVESDDEETTFRPYDRGEPVETCPNCGQWPNLSDVGVPTSSLLSYMLTEICRVSPSKKTLVFSDSHSAAESVGDRIIQTEYGLMAEALYVQQLIDADGSEDNYTLFRAVSDRLRDEYWQPLIQNSMNEDGTAFNFLNTLLEDIESHAMLHNATDLLDSALVTPGPVMEFDTARECVLAHELFKLFAKSPGGGFTTNTVEINGYTFGKLVDRLENRTHYDRETIERALPEMLAAFLEVNIIADKEWEEVQQTILDANADEDKKEAAFDFIEAGRERYQSVAVSGNRVNSGVFARTIKQDTSEMLLLERAAFCSECYRSFPVPDDDELSSCAGCGAPIETYRRFRRTDDGTLVADPGYAEADTGWPFAIDHWAHDVTTPIRGGADPEFISVGIHKGNIPHTLRGAIEEGFRKDDPDVNIVSSTPTMELGVDIGTLDTVCQVGIPPTLTNYVQRSGRTGRSRGSSSLVMTAIRGEHPVDGHYYSDLETFLDDFEPVRVPDPYEFDEILAGHVVTEVFAYLARNPHHSNVFERMYRLNEDNQNLAKFVNDVQENLNILIEFMLDTQRDQLERHLRDLFGEAGINAFDAVFTGDGPLSMTNRIEKTFARITALSGSAETNKAFTESNSRLDQWLSRLGYLANYRSFGQQFPVKLTGYTEDIEFEVSGRLYDMYPGEENDLGGLVTLHGSDYIVDDVRGTATPLATVALCANEECAKPFESYGLEVSHCPHCDVELEETNVHGISSVECKTARGGQKMYRTYGLMTTSIRADDSMPPVETRDTRLFGLPCQVTYGELEVTDFVYAFERGHSASPDTETLRSEALIERDGSRDTSGLSWQERLDDADTEEYAPVGQQYHTQGLTLAFDGEEFETRFEQLDQEIASWPQALTSLEQALSKAIAVTASCDLSDFRVKATKTAGEVTVRVVDSRQGGNGITWQVLQGLADVESQTRSVADCDRCRDYCDECLLLSRTPAYYLDNDLLNHTTLQALVGGPPPTPSVSD